MRPRHIINSSVCCVSLIFLASSAYAAGLWDSRRDNDNYGSKETYGSQGAYRGGAYRNDGRYAQPASPYYGHSPQQRPQRSAAPQPRSADYYRRPPSSGQRYDGRDQPSHAPGISGSLYVPLGLEAFIAPTLGVGYAYRLNHYSNVRGELNFGRASKTKEIDGAGYNFKFKVFNAGVYYDYFPFSDTDMRLVAGLVFNGSKIEGDAKVGNLGLTGEITLPRLAPYFGIGFGHGTAKARSGIGFFGDLGFYYGSSKAKLGTSGTESYSDEIKERTKKLEDYADDFKLIPVIRGGVNFSF